MRNEKTKNVGFTETSQLPVIKVEKEEKGNNYLLIIAIDKYEHVSQLNNAVRDAEKFKEILHNYYWFDKENTCELKNEDATKENILAKFDILLSKIKPDDNLILYFSGHGELHKLTQQGYWIPYEGKLKKRGTHLPNSEVINFFENLKARHVFAIVDSCFSGAMFKERTISSENENENDYGDDVLEKINSRWLLSSGLEEPVLDGYPGKHSPFAASLLSQLEAYSNIGINVLELYVKLKKGVENNSEQTPRCEPIYKVGHLGGQFVFRPKEYNPPKPIPKPKPKLPPPSKVSMLVLIIGSIVVMLLGTILYNIFFKSSPNPSTFDLNAYIYSDTLKQNKVENDSIEVSYGDTTDTLVTNKQGFLEIKGIPAKLKGKVITFSPIQKKYYKDEVLSHSIPINPEQDSLIAVFLSPEFIFSGIVLGEGEDKKGLKNAVIIVDGIFKDTTNIQGEFSMLLPFIHGNTYKPLSIKATDYQTRNLKREYLTDKSKKFKLVKE